MDGLIAVKLTCTACGQTDAYRVGAPVLSTPELYVNHPRKLVWPGDWDGFSTPTMVTCKHCGAVDRYTLTEPEKAQVDGWRKGLVAIGTSGLHDGTVPRRSSEAIQHLRRLVEANPQDGAGWRRLGNHYHRGGHIEQAVEAWQRAASDENEAEAAYSLAMVTSDAGQVALASQFARLALSRHPAGPDLPGRLKEGPLLDLVDVLWEGKPRGLSLLATWAADPNPKQPIVNMSSARLDRLEDGRCIARFLLTEKVLTVGFAEDTLPSDEPTTRLEALLGAGEPGAAPPRITGRNRKERREAERLAKKYRP